MKNSLYLWSLSELKRYTPGNVWSFIGRLLAFEKLGVPKNVTAKSLLYEAEFFIIGGFLITLLALPLIFRVLPDFPNEIYAQPLIFLLLILFITFFCYNGKFRKKSIKLKLLFSILPSFKGSQNLKIAFISFISIFFFGLGTYFSASSIFYINPKDVLLLSGFFGFAMLIGYLSLITPTGLGVREGILILGLTQVLPIRIAAFISIFTRIIFIISELFFLGLLWIWVKNKNNLIQKTENLIANHKHGFILALFIIFYIVYFTSATFLRHDNFYTGRFDLGNMDQTIWNTVHGRIFQITDPNGTQVLSRLAFHADFLLILFTPIYYLWRDPKILLLIQSVILPLGAVFVYLISEKILKHKNFSLFLAFCYLIYPPLNYANLFDFHPVTFATTFFLVAFYFMITKKYFWSILFLILAGITKEQIWTQTALFGLYIFVFQKKKMLGSLTFLASLTIFFYLIFKAIPDAAGGKQFALSYYSDFGESPGLIIRNVLLNPIRTLSILIQPDRLIYIIKILSPLALLPILSIYFLFTLPQIAINLLSNNIQTHEIFFQYTSSITPFLFISTVYAVHKLRKLLPNLGLNFLMFVVLLFSLFSAYEYGPLPGSVNPNISMFTNKLHNNGEIRKFLIQIPKIYSISSTNNLGAHLSHREKIYTVPVGIGSADFILFLTRGSEVYDPAIKKEKGFIKEVKDNPNYVLTYQNGDFIAFQKKDVNFTFKR